ncbi:MAG TPA: hypothetical protein VKU41_02115, partial [Polyangiaceae bacterium]|nr:hypothetical protein [Polyangiaceae bacterium]
SLKVDGHDQITGSESLAGTAPIGASSGCTASPASYTLGFAALFGKTGFGVTGGPGVVQGNAVTINLDSQATGLGWSATPSTYQYTCGPYTSAKTILFFGELGVPVVTYVVHLPLTLFKQIGHAYPITVENVENTKFTETFTLTSAS